MNEKCISYFENLLEIFEKNELSVEPALKKKGKRAAG